ncbi:hypothetical protein ABID21_002376 [Pseudorhizobium tarimense]|uniref:T6SS Phospholipase effector Tle1-like catalytic domain-containing protein n=1 Tax=Pseudorhizobium tarimense TaxID=1079109 RepID=A0ABV2H6U2_9HYPH
MRSRRRPEPNPGQQEASLPQDRGGELPLHHPPIHFIGVWDTVDSLGIRDDMALLNLLDNPQKHRFHDTTLSPIVRHVRHAVALDQFRQSFLPPLGKRPKTGRER